MNMKQLFIIILFVMVGCFSVADNYVVLKPELFIEEGEDDSSPAFAHVSDFELDSSGNLYILNGLDCEVNKYDNKNKFIMKFGRKGRGPGEFSYPTAIQIIGNRIIVNALNSSIFDLNGKYIDTLPYASFNDWRIKHITPYKRVGSQLDHERFRYDLSYQSIKDKTLKNISSFDARPYVKRSKPGKWTLTNTIREYKYNIDSKGNVVWAFSDKLDIFKYENGKSKTIIQDSIKPKPLSKEKRKYLSMAYKSPDCLMKKMPDYYQLISHINIDEKDNIWINVTGAYFSGFIKYSNEGKYLGRFKYKRLLKKELSPEGWMKVKIRYGYIYFRVSDPLKGQLVYRAKIPK